MYDKVHQASQETEWMRITGAPIAVASTVLTLAGAVSSIVEPIIKGLANIFGSPFTDECRILRGLKQIFITLPLKTIVTCIAFPIHIVVGAPITFVAILIAPKSYSDYRGSNHRTNLSKIEKLSDENFQPSGCLEQFSFLFV